MSKRLGDGRETLFWHENWVKQKQVGLCDKSKYFVLYHCRKKKKKQNSSLSKYNKFL